MKSKSINGKSAEEIQSALAQTMAAGFAPTLAIIFISVKQDRQAVCEIFNQRKIDIVGATSSGEFTNGYQSEGATAILLLDIPKDNYRVLFENTIGKDIAAAGERAARTALSIFSKPA